MPHNDETATLKSNWLLERIRDNSITGSYSALAILKSWSNAKVYESPKAIVVGVVVVAIPGITMGRFSKRQSMAIIIRRNLTAKQNNLQLALMVAKSSHGVMQKAINMVHGNISKLEPEIADWFFGERNIVFYSGEAPQFQKIENELTSLGIIHASIEDENGAGVMAISPAVSSSSVEFHWGLEPIEI